MVLSIPHIHVSCGALVNPEGEVLLVERPAGKIAEHKWEFPGGKIEPGESARDCLVRELEEEIGISVAECRPLIQFTHVYRERSVSLYTWRVESWTGPLIAREGQQFAWQEPSSTCNLDVLPTVAPILSALKLPQTYVFTRPDASVDDILGGLSSIPFGSLLRLRLPKLDADQYRQIAGAVVPIAHDQGLKVILDREPEMVRDLGADGWHQTQSKLMSLEQPPVLLKDALRLGSCHDELSIAKAASLGCDAIVIGSVNPTLSHPGETSIGWTGFESLSAQSKLPAFAIGGLGQSDLEAAFTHYAQGIAGISGFWRTSI